MKSRQILGGLAISALLGACGQQGGLYLPTEPAAQKRATLPQTLLPAPAPSSPASQTARP